MIATRIAINACAVLLAAGCVSSRRGEIEQARQKDASDIVEFGLSKMVMSFCDGDDEAGAPRMHRVANGEHLVRQRCGMVAVEVLADDAVATFIDDVCEGTDGPECGQALWEMFIARMEERYTFASWDQVLRRCKAHPADCKQWMTVEFWVTESHNDGVLAWARGAFDTMNAHYEAEFERAYQEEAAQRRRIGAALQAFGESFKPEPAVRCTSNTYGSTTYTNCR